MKKRTPPTKPYRDDNETQISDTRNSFFITIEEETNKPKTIILNKQRVAKHFVLFSKEVLSFWMEFNSAQILLSSPLFSITLCECRLQGLAGSRKLGSADGGRAEKKVSHLPPADGYGLGAFAKDLREK